MGVDEIKIKKYLCQEQSGVTIESLEMNLENLWCNKSDTNAMQYTDTFTSWENIDGNNVLYTES